MEPRDRTKNLVRVTSKKTCHEGFPSGLKTAGCQNEMVPAQITRDTDATDYYLSTFRPDGGFNTLGGLDPGTNKCLIVLTSIFFVGVAFCYFIGMWATRKHPRKAQEHDKSTDEPPTGMIKVMHLETNNPKEAGKITSPDLASMENLTSSTETLTIKAMHLETTSPKEAGKTTSKDPLGIEKLLSSLRAGKSTSEQQ